MVRFAELKDISRINELRKMVFELHVEGRPDIFKPNFNKEIQECAVNYLNEENHAVVVSERNGAICGFAMIDYIDKPESVYGKQLVFKRIADSWNWILVICNLLMDYYSTQSRMKLRLD